MPIIERLIGTIRRECLDHVVVFNERSLCHHLRTFRDCLPPDRTHLALEKDSPEPRPIEASETSRILSFPEVDGLHHRYDRRAA